MREGPVSDETGPRVTLLEFWHRFPQDGLFSVPSQHDAAANGQRPQDQGHAYAILMRKGRADTRPEHFVLACGFNYIGEMNWLFLHGNFSKSECDKASDGCSLSVTRGASMREMCRCAGTERDDHLMREAK